MSTQIRSPAPRRERLPIRVSSVIAAAVSAHASPVMWGRAALACPPRCRAEIPTSISRRPRTSPAPQQTRRSWVSNGKASSATAGGEEPLMAKRNMFFDGGRCRPRVSRARRVHFIARPLARDKRARPGRRRNFS